MNKKTFCSILLFLLLFGFTQTVNAQEKSNTVENTGKLNSVSDENEREEQFYFVEETYGTLVIENGFLPEEIEQAKKRYDRLPQNIKNYLIRKDIPCIYTKDKEKFICVSDYASGYTVSSCIRTGKELETIKYEMIMSVVKKQDSILHEIGHAIDKSVGTDLEQSMPLCSYADFDLIYKKEAKDSGLDVYYCSRPEEYFAESFQQSLLNGDLLQKNAPLTYQYMCALWTNIE